MLSGDQIQLLITAIFFVGVIAAAAVYIKSQVVKQTQGELEVLVDTRGERVKDLETEVKDLRRELDELRGEVKALQGLKATEIADEVVSRLSDILK